MDEQEMTVPVSDEPEAVVEPAVENDMPVTSEEVTPVEETV